MNGPLFTLLNGISSGNVGQVISSLILIGVILLICFPLHELGHAVVATYLGDDTPRLMGRLTLNPFAHLSLLGSALFVLFGFGWATTPVNYSRMRGSYGNNRALVSVAGPLVNLSLAVLSAGVFRLVDSSLSDGTSLMSEVVYLFLVQMVRINLLLMVFNLLPLPGLDGWGIIRGLIPEQIAQTVERFQQIAWIIIIATPIAGTLISGPVNQLFRVLTGL